MSSLGEDFPKQQARIRELIRVYEQIGPAGTFGKVMLEDTLRRADRAAISGDAVEMVRVYQEMKSCQ